MQYRNLNMDEIMKQDIVVFTVKGCIACEIYKRSFKSIVKDKLNYMILDISENDIIRNIAILLNIQAFPTTVLIKDGKIKLEVGNFNEKKIKTMIKEQIGKDV